MSYFLPSAHLVPSTSNFRRVELHLSATQQAGDRQESPPWGECTILPLALPCDSDGTQRERAVREGFLMPNQLQVLAWARHNRRSFLCIVRKPETPTGWRR